MRLTPLALALLGCSLTSEAPAQSSVTMAAGQQRAARQPSGATQPAMIPTVLASTIFGNFFGGGAEEPHFTVGRVPASWPAALLPGEGATIVGGSEVGGMRQIVVAYPRATNGIASYKGVLDRAGYREPDSTALPPRDGFASGAGITGLPTARIFCGDSSRVVIMKPLDSTATMRRLLVGAFPRLGGMPLCSPAMRAREAMYRVELPLTVPPLEAPRGVVVQALGRSTSNDSFDLRADTDTSLSAEALVAHYGAALVRGGWTIVGLPATGAGAGLVALRARDPKGGEWHGVLTVHTVGGRREVHIRMALPSDD